MWWVVASPTRCWPSGWARPGSPIRRHCARSRTRCWPPAGGTGRWPRHGDGWHWLGRRCPLWTSIGRPTLSWSRWPSTSWSATHDRADSERGPERARRRGGMTAAAKDTATSEALARETLSHAVAHLRGRQDPRGWWKGEL